MALTIEEWLGQKVEPYKDKSIRWLSEHHFFRDPMRPQFSDPAFFFSPADGIIIYQKVVDPREPIVEIKGTEYSLCEAMRCPRYDRKSLVIGIFMTFYDVHVNRMPYAGRVSYKELPPIDSYNYPMLSVETGFIEQLCVDIREANYLHNNQRILNRVDSPALHDRFYVLQVADYDVDSITPFELKQNQQFAQNARFSQIRYGSQVDLIVPLSDRYDFEFVHDVGVHVEAGVDPLIRIHEISSHN